MDSESGPILSFAFEAKSRLDGSSGVLTLEIYPPKRLPESPYDFQCEIQLGGVVEKRSRAVGVAPLQAIDLAIQVSKALIGAYAADWRLFYEGAGPIPLDY